MCKACAGLFVLLARPQHEPNECCNLQVYLVWVLHHLWNNHFPASWLPRFRQSRPRPWARRRPTWRSCCQLCAGECRTTSWTSPWSSPSLPCGISLMNHPGHVKWVVQYNFNANWWSMVGQKLRLIKFSRCFWTKKGWSCFWTCWTHFQERQLLKPKSWASWTTLQR